MKRVVLVATALLLGGGCASHVHTAGSPENVSQTGSAHPKTVIDADGTYLGVIDLDGKYLVGELDNLFPGKYRNAGGTKCYWARMRSIDPDDIIESRETSDPQTIEIRATDVAFVTKNCGIWQRVLE
ncbi:hypothetical protein [Mycolicibacterium pulveris]|uniref:hypothetical protein n=1 Tax=Mycolicibacterium pulveris TaxID=36813 RepID=UPI003CF4AB59